MLESGLAWVDCNVAETSYRAWPAGYHSYEPGRGSSLGQVLRRPRHRAEYGLRTVTVTAGFATPSHSVRARPPSARDSDCAALMWLCWARGQPLTIVRCPVRTKPPERRTNSHRCLASHSSHPRLTLLHCRPVVVLPASVWRLLAVATVFYLHRVPPPGPTSLTSCLYLLLPRL